MMPAEDFPRPDITAVMDRAFIPALRYASLTRAYDLVVRTTTRERVFKRTLMAQAGIEAGHLVLDVGCGTGTLAIWIKKAQPLADVRGIDGDPAILAIAAHKADASAAQVRFDRAMSHELPYADGEFDRVVTSLFFHHLSPVAKRETAREILRVLKPGGQLHVADWGKPANGLMRGLFLLVQLLDGFRTTKENVTGQLPGIFSEAGFESGGQRQRFSTMLGTISLYAARKPMPAPRSHPEGRSHEYA
jgi:ubiquinone/menaquinone biosynthesis C-methylase UbiE